MNKFNQVDLERLQNQLTIVQKSAIMGGLFLVANSNHNPDIKVINIVEKIGDALKINMADPVVANFAKGGQSNLINILKTLTNNQIELFIISIHTVAMADGIIEAKQLNAIEWICSIVGITEIRYLNIIEKNNKITAAKIEEEILNEKIESLKELSFQDRKNEDYRNSKHGQAEIKRAQTKENIIESIFGIIFILGIALLFAPIPFKGMGLIMMILSFAGIFNFAIRVVEYIKRRWFGRR
jgi:hypothetical protein